MFSRGGRACVAFNLERWRRISVAFSSSSQYPPLEPEGAVSMRSGHPVPSGGNVERLIGYPTPLLSLRHLLGSELSQLSGHVRRLLSSGHPIVEQTKWFLNSHSKGKYSLGMLTLLAAKSFNSVNSSIPELDQFGILPGQRVLAEVTEMIHIAHMIHQEVVDLSTKEEREERDDLSFGNKMVILGGDLLLARACKELALLYKPQIVSIMSKAISNLMENSFILPSQQQPTAVSLSSTAGSLLGSSCRSCAIIAQLDTNWQELAVKLGTHLSILQHISNQLFLMKTENVENVSEIRILKDSYYHHCSIAWSLLEELPDSESRLVLEDFISRSSSNL